ncbi:hypothetical protein ACQFX9_01675 [Aliinostoc sp. HNIBRCY26]|uniref:hypothetical protein n=1 Tax=Aliinostoc sp. HNIBRCY26 TaxID=3418997 RepID=UPI003D083BBD
MNPKLSKFLKAEDLDDALRVLQEIGKLDGDDSAHIQQILADWSPPQAVANILIYTLMPQDQRIDYLLQGLRDDNVPYFALAATVGFQNVKAEAVTESQRQLIVNELFRIIEQYPQFAGRATVSISPFLRLNDAPRMFSLLDMLDGSSRHNVLAWLITEIGVNSQQEFLQIAENSGISVSTIQLANNKLEEYNQAQAEGKFTNIGFKLMSYIPNLQDMLE